ncbi:MAG: SGNH/GDSL hydrolase family protein, partial [Gloeobacteraceae cyanobacterium ES-bin-316]|nr:SGNH/GDSL hydrolase family protein [Ferruginibacter sp.]
MIKGKLFLRKRLFYLHLEMNYSYLALGDSYTIGERVLLAESFPYQTVRLLRQTAVGAESRRQGFGWQFTAAEIIAKTGWTTDELNTAIQQTTFLKQYNVVSLLIGVNNQYRGRSVTEFATEFKQLVKIAVVLAGENPAAVFILSIPDWGITPFAEGKDRQQISCEIDAYNDVCKLISQEIGCTYVDITASQRADGNNKEFFAEDGLHPSAKEYAKWAEKLSS